MKCTEQSTTLAYMYMYIYTSQSKKCTSKQHKSRNIAMTVEDLLHVRVVRAGGDYEANRTDKEGEEMH